MHARALLFLALVVGCGKPPVVPRAAPGLTKLGSITITSPAFSDGGRLPVDLTCDGKDIMPELVLSSPPENTKSLLLMVDDPDASGETFTHLLAFNVTPDLRKFPGGPELGPAAGDTARYGLNDYKVAGYRGPCPPKGEIHRYRFRVVAVDTVLKLGDGSPKEQVFEAIDQHILGEGTLTGNFGH